MTSKNILKKVGLSLFLISLIIFIGTSFIGNFIITESIVTETLSEQEQNIFNQHLKTKILGKTYTNVFSFYTDFKEIDFFNDKLKEAELWDQVIYSSPPELTFKLAQKGATGSITNHPLLLLFLTIGLGFIGGLMYIIPSALIPISSRNNGIFKNPSTNRGWVGILITIFLITFYITLYFYPYIIVNQTIIISPIKQIFDPSVMAGKWFLYGFLYCVSMISMGVRMIIKYRNDNHQKIRTLSVVFFQIVFAFLLVEILPLFGLPAKDLKSAWPLDYSFLFDWNIKNFLDSGKAGMFMLFWGVILSLVLVPIFTYFFGKRWYCSWVCGCGGLAETLGDPYRQLSSKKEIAWKIERWMIYPVFLFAIVLSIWTGYHTYNEINNPLMADKATLLGISAFSIRNLYGFIIGSIFSGVIGTGLYPILGNRTWCRFGCPLAAYMGIVQKFKSRFRITTNGGQCISCGNCSTYCEQGIDVRSYAQMGQNIVRSSCVGCGVCASVCPRGVLKLENGDPEGRISDNPILLGQEK